MNLQGNNDIFLDEEVVSEKPSEPSKLKQNLDKAKKLDREIPYSVSREAYAKKQSELYQARLAALQKIGPGEKDPAIVKHRQPKVIEDEPDEVVQLHEEVKEPVYDPTTDIKNTPEKEEPATERLEGVELNRRVVDTVIERSSNTQAANKENQVSTAILDEVKDTTNNPPTTKAPLQEEKNDTAQMKEDPANNKTLSRKKEFDSLLKSGMSRRALSSAFPQEEEKSYSMVYHVFLL